MLIENGTIQSHRLASLKLAERKVTEDSHNNDGFVIITDDQVRYLAGRVSFAVWLQRTMGLRIGEALGVEKSDFINGGKTLRLTWQASLDGKTRVPLKKRKAGQFRDIPVPAFIQHMVAELPEGPLMPGMRSRYVPYTTIQQRFTKATTELGVGGFTSHSNQQAAVAFTQLFH